MKLKRVTILLSLTISGSAWGAYPYPMFNPSDANQYCRDNAEQCCAVGDGTGRDMETGQTWCAIDQSNRSEILQPAVDVGILPTAKDEASAKLIRKLKQRAKWCKAHTKRSTLTNRKKRIRFRKQCKK